MHGYMLDSLELSTVLTRLGILVCRLSLIALICRHVCNSGKENLLDAWIWYSGVPSMSNCADMPSRQSERDDLIWIDGWLQLSKPRNLSPPYGVNTVVIFTDGACEFDGDILATCGAVLYTGEGQPLRCWGGTISDALVAEWAVNGKRQVVTEAELLPILISRKIWAKWISNRKVNHFVDSNPALFSSLRGISDVSSCQNIIKACCSEENKLNSWIWYSRVPSKSNCADMPSRLKFWESMFGRFPVVTDEFMQPKTLRHGIWE